MAEWQYIVTGIAVGLSLCYAFFRIYRSISRTQDPCCGCDGCRNCDPNIRKTDCAAEKVD